MDQTAPPSQQQPSNPPPKNFLKKLLPFVIVGVVMFGIGIVTCSLLSSSSPKKVSEVTPLPTASPVQEEIPADMTSSQLADITVEWQKQVPSDWISYTDKMLGYSLKYPAKWYLYPGSLERHHGDWLTMPLYISSIEDKNHDKTATGELPLSTNQCFFILNPSEARETQTMKEVVEEQRPEEAIRETSFQNEQAFYLAQLSSKLGKVPTSELWFVGPKAEGDIDVSVKTQWWMLAKGGSETDSSDTCSDIFKTIMTSYQQPQPETTIDPAR